MLVILCMTLVFLVDYWSYVIYATNHPDWSCSNAISNTCATSVCAYLPAIGLANAVVLNLNKWVYFKLRINAFIKVGFGCSNDEDSEPDEVNTDSEVSVSARHKLKQTTDVDVDESFTSNESAVLDMYEQTNRELKSKQRLNNIVCILLAGAYTTATLVFMIDPCISNSARFNNPNRYLTLIFYGVLGFAFMVTGISMNISLQRYFKHFYNMFSYFLWIACFFLTVPLFVRVAMNILLLHVPKFKAWYLNWNNFTFTNTFYLIFTTYIPIVTQMSSLVFGYLRK